MVKKKKNLEFVILLSSLKSQYFLRIYSKSCSLQKNYEMLGGYPRTHICIYIYISGYIYIGVIQSLVRIGSYGRDTGG